MLIVGMVIAGWFGYGRWLRDTAKEPVIIQPVETDKSEAVEVHTEEVMPELAKKSAEPEAPSQRDSLETPFIVQAPNGEWDNPFFENGCEEASMLMVARLLAGQGALAPTEAKKELLKISAYEEKVFGHAFDTSATDTARMLQEYFSIESQVEVLDEAVGLQKLLEQGHVVLIPTDGKKLKNPFFTAHGPETHMLVALAFDTKTGEYIVHDPGTKRGERYRYTKEVLWSALRDYPTGATHLPNNKTEKRVVIIPLK